MARADGVDGGEIDVDLPRGAQHVDVLGRQAAGLGDLLRGLAQGVVAQGLAALVLGHAVQELRVLDQHVGGLGHVGSGLLGGLEGGERLVVRAFDGEQLAERELIGGRGWNRRRRNGRRGGEGGQQGQAGGAKRE